MLWTDQERFVGFIECIGVVYVQTTDYIVIRSGVVSAGIYILEALVFTDLVTLRVFNICL